MNLIEAGPQWGLYLFIALLALAAIEDGWRLKISNVTVGAMLIGGIVMAVLAGPDWSLWQNLLLLVLMLALGTLLFSMGWMGGGDVKLLAASLFWFDLSGGFRVLITVAIIGGALTILLLGGRMIFGSKGGIGALREGAGMPYGIAIAIGAGVTAYWMSLPG